MAQAKLDKLVRIRERQRSVALAQQAMLKRQAIALQERIDAVIATADALPGRQVDTLDLEVLTAELGQAHAALQRTRVDEERHEAVVRQASIAAMRAQTLLERAREATRKRVDRHDAKALDDLRIRRRS